jgi:hypothetical protein
MTNLISVTRSLHMANIIHIAYGPDGTIFAASESKNVPRPVNKDGVRVGEFEVPTKFGGMKMLEYLPHLVVDVAAGRLNEK